MSRFTLARFRARLYRYFERRRSRRQLLALDDRLLKDVGISRAQVHRESRRRF